MKRTLIGLVGLGCVWLSGTTVIWGGNETNGAPARVGIYDSRAVAYAYFWSEPHQRKIKELAGAAKAAKQSGDTARFNECDAALRAEQERNHRQVFSTAPVDDALATIKARIPEIQKQAGVTNLLSKWDQSALKHGKTMEKIDVTDRLVREFIQPSEKQAKVISDLLKHDPLPLEKCDELIRKGKL